MACISGTEILDYQEEEETSKTADTSDGGGIAANMANVPAVDCPIGAALASWRLVDSSGSSLAIEYTCRPCVVKVKEGESPANEGAETVKVGVASV